MLHLIRHNGTFQKSIDLLSSGQHFEFADQDSLNHALWRTWISLYRRWNFQRKFLCGGKEHQRPVIVHFTEQENPGTRTSGIPMHGFITKPCCARGFENPSFVKPE